MNLLTALENIQVKDKRIEFILDSDISKTVVININGNYTKWTDNEKGYISEEVYKKHFNGNLRQCLDYLQSFQLKGDLNEIYHTLNN